MKVLRKTFWRIYSKCIHPLSVFVKPLTMADLSLFRRLVASCATMLPLLPKEEQDEARKISLMFTKAVEDMETVSKMLYSDQDKKVIKVEVVEQVEDRGTKIVETSGADVKPSDVDEILTKYKIGR